MSSLIWGKSFIRAFKKTIKKHPSLSKDIDEPLRILVQDPFDPQLETHKLKGKLFGSWACSVGYDLRIVFDFVKSEEREEDDILLLGIGTHDEVY